MGVLPAAQAQVPRLVHTGRKNAPLDQAR